MRWILANIFLKPLCGAGFGKTVIGRDTSLSSSANKCGCTLMIKQFTAETLGAQRKGPAIPLFQARLKRGFARCQKEGRWLVSKFP
jgi:hypothetical protein